MRKAFLLLCLSLLLLPLAAESFYVKDYQVRIDVDEAKRLHVEEDLGLFFTSPSHGIARDIQYRFPGVEAEVSAVKASELYSLSKGNGYVTAYLGSKDELVTGDKRFTLSYDYALPADNYRGYDELYYNIVSGEGWDVPMERVSFSVTFPKIVDEGRIWVTWGRYGSESTLPFSVSEDGRTVSGSYLNLPAGHSITLRVELDDGYFAKALGWERALMLLAAFLCLLALVALFALYLRFGREEPLVCPARFSPPEGFNPMDTAWLYSGTVSVDTVSAMLLYWAGKGLLEISEEGDGYSFSCLGFPGEDAPLGEKALFTAFFGDRAEADAASLRARDFPSLLEGQVRQQEASLFTGERALHSEESVKAMGLGRKILLALSVLFSLLMALSLHSPLALFMIVPAFMAYMVLGQKAPLPVTLFLIVFLAVFMGTASPESLPASLSYLAAMAAGGRIAPAIRKRSRYGQARLEEAEGFKEFIDKVEKDRIRVLCENDPGLFYSVLPYAMVFGLSEKWCDKFKGLYVRPAAWYRSRGPWDIYMLSRFGRGFRDSYRRNVTPGRNQGGRPTHRGYSGHAGGGFSGGGGHSW